RRRHRRALRRLPGAGPGVEAPVPGRVVAAPRMRLVAEPLKDSFGPEVIERIAADIAAVHPAFPRSEFVRRASDGFGDLELTPRARLISAALAATLPADRGEALRVLGASLGPPLGDRESGGMAAFVYLPHVYFVADHGLDHFEEAMWFQHEVTRRFTAEYSIRTFLDAHTQRTLAQLREWASDPDMHVRRLVSEGTRPRLPWAPRLQRFIDDPSPAVDLLELLKDDRAEYVRRSVANNLNDISKDPPQPGGRSGAALAATAGAGSTGPSRHAHPGQAGPSRRPGGARLRRAGRHRGRGARGGPPSGTDRRQNEAAGCRRQPGDLGAVGARRLQGPLREAERLVTEGVQGKGSPHRGGWAARSGEDRLAGPPDDAHPVSGHPSRGAGRQRQGVGGDHLRGG